MTPHALLEFLAPLLLCAACGFALRELRAQARERRIRRITQRLLE